MKLRMKRFIVDTPYGPAEEERVVSSNEEVLAQLPSVDSRCYNAYPTPDEIEKNKREVEVEQARYRGPDPLAGRGPRPTPGTPPEPGPVG